MRQTKFVGVEFNVDSYTEITDFINLTNNTKENSSIVAAMIACAEGIIKLGKDKDYFSFAGIYKVKYSNNYKFLNICSIINKNKEMYNYIVNFFNLWHKVNYEEFSYDEFSKNDIRNNLYELVSLLYEERNLSLELNDKKEAEAYKTIFNILIELFEVQL